MIPGEITGPDTPIEINSGRTVLTLNISNGGDRPIQVGSHYHFAEANPHSFSSVKQRMGIDLTYLREPQSALSLASTWSRS